MLLMSARIPSIRLKNLFVGMYYFTLDLHSILGHRFIEVVGYMKKSKCVCAS